MPIKTDRVVFIPKGSIGEIISHLAINNHYNVGKFDKYLLWSIGKPQQGWIDIKKTSSTRYDFLSAITTSKAALVDITLIPGETLYFFFEEVAKTLNLSELTLMEEYLSIAPLPDGIILPETYKVPIGISEEKLVYLLLENSIRKHKEFSHKLFGKYEEARWFRYITMASVIQKEAANNKEMPLVSAVIYNRLKNRMRLQMDGTLNYGKYSHTRVTPKMIRTNSTSYNTYRYNGIPKYPVCSVSVDAIKAAIYPANVDYLYFMKNKKGHHDFSKSYTKHLQNIKNVKK